MESPRSFTNADDDRLIALIRAARTRLVFASPGISKPVGEVLAEVIGSPLAPAQLAVILDVDPEVCRLGYGTLEGLEAVQRALEARHLRLQSADGLRVGLLVSDDQTLIYSPTPLLIEAGSEAPSKPNAILLQPNPAETLAAACGAGEEPEAVEIGKDFVSEKRLEEVKADLKETPPKQFNLARLERVFNYRLEFVEFSVEHYKLNTRSVPLSPEILGLAEPGLEDRFRNTFRVFQKGAPFRFEVSAPDNPDLKFELTEDWLNDRATELRKEYFIPLGSSSYGNLIQKRLKTEFEDRVADFKDMVELYAEKVREAIGAKIKETRAGLIAALLPRVKAAPPKSWLRRSVDGKLSDKEVLSRLEQEVDRAFEKVEETFKPTVTCIFKGVNYETITRDPHFREKIEAYFGPEEASKLLDEHDSARGKEPAGEQKTFSL
jgi:hypothetical protein